SLPSLTSAEDIGYGVSTRIGRPAGNLSLTICGGNCAPECSATWEWGGPLGTRVIIISTASGTPRRFKSCSTGGKISKLQREFTILAMIGAAFIPLLDIVRTSLLCRTCTGIGGGAVA